MDASRSARGRAQQLTRWSSQILFVINSPEVYKSPNSNTYM